MISTALVASLSLHRIDDAMVDQAVTVIKEKANTGKIGDGKIFISEIIEAIRIRTGESGADAI